MKIKWNEYTWYSRLAAFIFFIGVLPTWTFYIGIQYEKTIDSLSLFKVAQYLNAGTYSGQKNSNGVVVPATAIANADSNTQSNIDDPNDPVFTSTFGKTYAAAKKELAASGWSVDMSIISSSSPSANDSQFPEINGCGSGIDAVCSVGFKKGTVTTHLDVQIEGRQPYGPYSEWTVVGND